MVKTKRLHVAKSLSELRNRILVPRQYVPSLALQRLWSTYEAEKHEAEQHLNEENDQELAYLAYCNALEFLKIMQRCQEDCKEPTSFQTKYEQQKAECEHFECVLRIQLEERYEDMERMDYNEKEAPARYTSTNDSKGPQRRDVLGDKQQLYPSTAELNNTSMNPSRYTMQRPTPLANHRVILRDLSTLHEEKQENDSIFSYSPRREPAAVSRSSSFGGSTNLSKGPYRSLRQRTSEELPSRLAMPELASLRITKPSTRECVVCLVEKPATDFIDIISSACRHTQRQICRECVRENTRTAMSDSSATEIRCPEQGCDALLDFHTVRDLVVNLNTVLGRSIAAVNQYEDKLSMKYVETMEDFMWCAHGCGHGVQLVNHFLPWYECVHCKQRTCVRHRVRWHSEMTCAEYDEKLKSDREEQGNQGWLRDHTKTCPRCTSPIEKNEGCDHMTCSRCKHEFCWQCLADWKPLLGIRHQYH